ncbi:MAG: extracellular solute-binding protein [Ruminococcus flavefaciens]|nr:extracellular solute-binding protein [Ruminococcus flavefaciens]
MKKILTFIAVLAMLNTYSCSEKKEKSNSPAPSVSESSESDGKTTFTIATTLVDVEREKNTIANKMKCDVEVRYYPWSEEKDAFDLLYLDLISGENIDVVYSTSGDMTKLVRNDDLTDIYPLMEQSETLKKEDFLPNILAGLEVDGKLPVICDDWKLFTAVAKTENVGENMENWTPAQAWEAYHNMPEDMAFLGFSHFEYDELNYWINRVAIDAVDYQNNTCDFGGAFMEMLENVNNLPPFQTTYWEDSDFINNHCLVERVDFFGINSTMSQQLCAEFGGADITFVGYPSETGKGYSTDVFSMIGILETSPHKQEGYEFIDFMLHDLSTIKNMMYSMPVTEKQLKEQLNATKYSGLSINAPQYIYGSGEQITMSEEAKQQVVDYIRRIEFEPYTSDTVDNMVFEEYHKCFAGETTPQQCADILNNRVSLYLSETE